jgi:uncharacterized integral membrane protein
MSRFFSILLLILAALLAILVTAMNAGRVEVELAFARITSPLGVALIVAFTIGMLAGMAWQAKWVTRLLSERGRLRRALRIAESKARGEGIAAK